MDERNIFLAAIEITDSDERTAYLDRACAGNAELRGQVEELLTSHSEASRFLETPAVAAFSAVDCPVPNDAPDTDDDLREEGRSGQSEFQKYLESATRPGYLGRLAHYQVEEILGHGAFGIVAKAFDEKLHRIVAIKMMSPELAATSPPRKRFLREARTAAAVTHENIVSIYAVEEQPIPFLVMEFISGRTLQQCMDLKGPLETGDILRIGQQVAAGLDAAHKANLIHRDIKPSNILLTDSPVERAKISDFGLARAVDDASMTTSGLIAGTPLYMAPEQARGETLDHRADLFSLGSVLYQMASGRPPFRAPNTVAVLKRVCEDTPRPLDDVIPETPAWLRRIIFKLLEKDRDKRYQSAQEVADLLARCEDELRLHGQVTCVDGCSGTSETTAILARQKTTGLPGRKKSMGWLIGIVIAASILVGLVLFNGNAPTPVSLQDKLSDHKPSAAQVGASPSPATSKNRHSGRSGAPSAAIAPFDVEQAKVHQEAWGRYLRLPVERVIVLPGGVPLTMMLIPPGEFQMGSTREELAGPISYFEQLQDKAFAQRALEELASQRPRHRVRITEPFYLGKYEVTQAQWEAVMGDNPSKFKHSPDHPVEQVSWNDVQPFLAKLQVIASGEALAFSLPTEAQWEYACRAGATSLFSFGNDPADLPLYSWNIKTSPHSTQPVGLLRANSFGLHDMHGNIVEWCADRCSTDYYAQSPVNNPMGPAEGDVGVVPDARIFRGGSNFNPNPSDSYHCARKYFGHKKHWKSHAHGFRVAATIAVAKVTSTQDSDRVASPGS